MKRPVISIYLDAVEPSWLEAQVASGHLPTLARLRQESARYPVNGVHPFQAELPHVAFLTAVNPDRLGYWGAFNYDVGSCKPRFLHGFDYQQVRPFYDYSPGLKVCQFDLPKAGLAKVAEGIQVLNWGAHGSLNDSVSNPPGVFGELKSAFGLHPALEKDHWEPWQTEEVAQLFDDLVAGVRLRTLVHRDLLGRAEWDLFMVAYSEMHSGGHVFMHLDDDRHMLHQSGASESQMLRIMQEIDTSIADLLAHAPAGAAINVFSTHGMTQNSWDANTMYFLPEFLHRMAFPARRKQPHGELPPAKLGTDWWNNTVWLDTFGDTRAMPRMDEGHNWIPSTWYVEDWPKMAAFSLPGFDEGMVRLNLKGRDKNGIIEQRNYERALRIIADAIRGLKNERTGNPLVNRVFRTRRDPMEDGAHLPPADLIVEWTLEPCDVAISPVAGRIGPVPLKRTGGHTRDGFAWFKSDQMRPGDYPAATPFDLGPTLLDLIGTDLPNHFEGQSLLRDWRKRTGEPFFEELL